MNWEGAIFSIQNTFEWIYLGSSRVLTGQESQGLYTGACARSSSRVMPRSLAFSEGEMIELSVEMARSWRGSLLDRRTAQFSASNEEWSSKVNYLPNIQRSEIYLSVKRLKMKNKPCVMSTYMLCLWPKKAENEIKWPMYIYKIHDFSKK